jgi:hypothetical protein
MRYSKGVRQPIRFGRDDLKLICASYGNEDEKILQRCQGTVIRLLREERTYVTVEIKWDKECLREGDREVSQDKLMRSKWISNEHKQGTWGENLYHMAKQQKIHELYHYELTMF